MQMTWPRSLNFAAPLGGMADDGRLAAFVRRGNGSEQVLPEQDVVRLLVERHVGDVVGMDEEVRWPFRDTSAVVQEIRDGFAGILLISQP